VRRVCLPALAAAVLMTSMLMAQIPTPTIVKKSPALDALIAADATFEKLGEGFKWTEGPVWSRKGGFLLFSDIPNNVIQKWEPGKGMSVFVKPSGYHGSAPFTGPEPGTNGLTFDSAGRLVACMHGDRQVGRFEDGKWSALAEKFEGKRLNSPNDLVFHSSGALYFTDPPYGLPGRWEDKEKELPFQGVYRRAGDGALTLLTKELNAPNGLAFSPDEKTLYVAQSDPTKAIWMAYPVKGDGTLGGGKVLVDSTDAVKAKQPGLPDGLKVDSKGNLWATGPGGVWIIAPDGTHLGTISTGVPTANVAWGDDGSTLYITANTAVWRVKTKTTGKIPG
jgi:gluconolactonase